MSADVQQIDALRGALTAAPDSREIRVLLAQLLESAGRWDEAVVERRILLAATPDDVPAKVALATAYRHAGQRGPAEVILDELERDGTMPREGWNLRGAMLDLPEMAPDPAADPDPAAHVSQASSGAHSDDHDAPVDEPLDDRLERPTITFADVGGMAALKESIRLKILYPATHPEIYAAYGKRAGGGLLLYGPPGCGKTYLARATAGEMRANFIGVGIADVLESLIGQSERNLHAIFEVARAHTPCILFFDEIDALAADRSDFKNTAGRSLINQFLAEFDGVSGNNDGILVLGATNAPWHLDSAFRRPGRFDEVLFVPPPDGDARHEIIRLQLRDRPVGRIDVDRIVRATQHFSGADIAGVVDRAVERKLAQALKDGQVHPIQTDDVLAAAKDVPPSTRDWFATIRNYVLYANQSGLYDPVRPYVK